LRCGAKSANEFRQIPGCFFNGVPIGLQPAFSPPMVMKNLQFRTVANRAATGKERYATAPFPSVFSTERSSTCGPPMVMKNSLSSRTTAS
jgi:hypothetical protein